MGSHPDSVPPGHSGWVRRREFGREGRCREQRNCSPIGRARSGTLTGVGEQQVTGNRRSYSSAEPLPRPGNSARPHRDRPGPKNGSGLPPLLTNHEGQLERSPRYNRPFSGDLRVHHRVQRVVRGWPIGSGPVAGRVRRSATGPGADLRGMRHGDDVVVHAQFGDVVAFQAARMAMSWTPNVAVFPSQAGISTPTTTSRRRNWSPRSCTGNGFTPESVITQTSPPLTHPVRHRCRVRPFRQSSRGISRCGPG